LVRFGLNLGLNNLKFGQEAISVRINSIGLNRLQKWQNIEIWTLLMRVSLVRVSFVRVSFSKVLKKKFGNLKKYVYALLFYSVTNTFFETTVFEAIFETTVEIFRYIRPPIFRCKKSFEASVFETSVFETNGSYRNAN
jgi:hypothetical protein